MINLCYSLLTASNSNMNCLEYALIFTQAFVSVDTVSLYILNMSDFFYGTFVVIVDLGAYEELQYIIV